MSLALEQPEPVIVHPHDWLLADPDFCELAGELWHACIEFHHGLDRHYSFYDNGQEPRRRPPHVLSQDPAKRRAMIVWTASPAVHLIDAEKALRQWLAHCQPPEGQAQPGCDDIDKFIHLIKREAVSGPHHGQSSSSPLAPAS